MRADLRRNRSMQHQPSRKPEELESHLLGLIEAARDQAREDPFRNPVLAVTLAVEFEQACAAANNGRLALDAFNGALLDAARARWPDRWTELTPRPFAIASWVGCDTDGRTDIGWWDTLRYRLISKRMQFDRV